MSLRRCGCWNNGNPREPKEEFMGCNKWLVLSKPIWKKSVWILAWGWTYGLLCIHLKNWKYSMQSYRIELGGRFSTKVLDSTDGRVSRRYRLN